MWHIPLVQGLHADAAEMETWREEDTAQYLLTQNLTSFTTSNNRPFTDAMQTVKNEYALYITI
jgi:hypothetical protein